MYLYPASVGTAPELQQKLSADGFMRIVVLPKI